MPKRRPSNPCPTAESARPVYATSAACPAGGTGPFDSRDDAAHAALCAANPASFRDNKEYAGLIFRGSDGKYYYTGPLIGADQGANPAAAPAPAGSTTVGDYHNTTTVRRRIRATGAAVRTSDPARDDFNSDQFSTTDKTGIANDGAVNSDYRGYLGTPSGTFRVYDPAAGTDTTF